MKPPVKKTVRMEKRVAELAAMTELEYDQVRVHEAKSLGLRLSTLDKAIFEKRETPQADHASHFKKEAPWGSPVTAADLLDEIIGILQTHTVMPPYAAQLIAAWVLFAWTHDVVRVSPLLALVSPEKRCGKTTVLTLIKALVPKPLASSNLSSASLFRMVDRWAPTVLIDEADTFLRDDRKNELRGILNAGHTRDAAFVHRCTGETYEPRAFNVWSPKVVAMIGRLPDTLEDRAIVMTMRRKRSSDQIERLRVDCMEMFEVTRRKLKRWSSDNLQKLRDADPPVPEALSDRAKDNVRYLVAIADLAGDHWPATIRDACLKNARDQGRAPQPANNALLRDIQGLFKERNITRISSQDLCDALVERDDLRWSKFTAGKPISPRGIANLLRDYGIKAESTRDGRVYSFCAFEDAFDRYLAPSE